MLFTTFAPLLGLVASALAKSGPPIRDLHFGDLNFLHTTDTHGWYSGHLNQKIYSGDWGDFISFAYHLRQLANDNGQDLLLVDSGDRHDGNGLSDITEPNGKRSLPIFIQQEYDIITLGNHELYLAENTKQEYELVAKHYGDRYVSTNVEYLHEGEWVALGNKFRYFKTPVQGTRILAFGFLFDFPWYNDQSRVTPIAEVIQKDWFQEILQNHPAEVVDTIVVSGHVPVDREWNELAELHAELRTHYPNTKIQYFGGHSHIRDFVVYDERSVALQSGRFCETVGFLSVNLNSTSSDVTETYSRSYIDFNTNSFLHHTKKASTDELDTKRGNEVKLAISKAREELGLDTVLGHVTKSNYFMDYVPISHPQSIFRLLTKKVLPTLKADEGVETSSERLTIINTGSIRYDLYKGPYTIDTHYIISPFKNAWVKVTVPKYIAVQIAPILNKSGYILSSAADEVDSKQLRPLKPPHQRSAFEEYDKRDQSVMQMTDFVEDLDVHANKLTKGYVTNDDFGNKGDDTPHRGVVNYPIPNVVQSVELKNTGRKTPVDLVFYDFITPHVKRAFESLQYSMPDPEIYSSNYLGELLNQYVADYGL